MNLLEELKKNPFLLAPMAAITDCAFRSYMREMGCGIVTTELVSANGLQYSSERTKKIMKFDELQHPVGIQIFGERLDALAFAAKESEAMGADFVDLNFGCPVPKVVKKGAGSAILKDLNALVDVLKTVKGAVNIPVTIKIRTGWDHESKNSIEVCKIAYEEGIEWVAIHGRTRSQAYTGKADWDYIAEVKANSKIPIIGNGDIVSGRIANRRLKESGCDGVMIGRGCLKNPWIFKEAMSIFNGQDQSTVDRNHLGAIELLIKYLTMHADERIKALQVKKLTAWYSTGYPGSANFRKAVFKLKEFDEVIEEVIRYFTSIKDVPQPDTFDEDFLMGGHG